MFPSTVSNHCLSVPLTLGYGNIKRKMAGVEQNNWEMWKCQQVSEKNDQNLNKNLRKVAPKSLRNWFV